jgi:energy-coupling factor transporter transmembrane protein EcfT
MRRYITNKNKIVLYAAIECLFIAIIMVALISVLNVIVNDIMQSIIWIVITFIFLFTITSVVSPNNMLWPIYFWNLKIQIDNDRLTFYYKNEYKSTIKFEYIVEIKYSNKLSTPDARVIILYNSEGKYKFVRVPSFIFNSPQLYKEIYENVKEKSPNAKIDRRFIKYVEEKC